mmetsp:Transcript_29695/g.79748  ORF Transcript_29695/g.79748 Transcript_29695/m.79748 type:complete len:293 (+) Transcript_29695:529-1407(+)
MSTACVFIKFSATHNPAAFIVVPVSTKSTTASARPRPTAASTEPEMSVIFVVTPWSLSRGSKNLRVRLGKEVAMRLPAKSAPVRLPWTSGTWSDRAHLPMPSSSSVLTVQLASATMSWPVMPASTLPMEMKEAMSLAGRKTRVMGRFVQGATSRRSRRWYCSPAASTNLRHISARRPFFGRARSMWLDVSVGSGSACLGTGTECATSAASALSTVLAIICASSSSSRRAAATAWPSSPSILASMCASLTSPAAVLWFVSWSHVRIRKKVKTLKPPQDRAVPPVGRVWLGPAP